jgi:hypothetical protein
MNIEGQGDEVIYGILGWFSIYSYLSQNKRSIFMTR